MVDVIILGTEDVGLYWISQDKQEEKETGRKRRSLINLDKKVITVNKTGGGPDECVQR